MANCDFYATAEDHKELLTWLFAEAACDVYELSSDFESPIKRFVSVDEVLAQFERRYTTGEKWKSVHLQLYVLGAGPQFTPRRVSLEPKFCNGATYRYAAEGWGLVQLYLQRPTPSGLESSHTNHSTQKRAEALATTAKARSEVAEWDFKKISAFSSRLNRQIKRLSAGKLGNRPVLPGALEVWQSDIPLLPYKKTEASLTLQADA